MADLLTLLNNDTPLRRAAARTLATLPRLVASKVSNDQQPTPQQFTTVGLNSVMLDTSASFASNMWTVPETGTYELNGKLRLSDNTPAGISFGIGMGINNVDDAAFYWATTTASTFGFAGNSVGRHMVFNSRIMQLTQGDLLRLYAFIDDTTARTIQAAELNAVRIA